MAESWAGGLNKGLVKGLQIGSMFEEGKARKEKGEVAKRQEKRQILTSKMTEITQFVGSELWKHVSAPEKVAVYKKYQGVMKEFGFPLPDIDPAKFGVGAAALTGKLIKKTNAVLNSNKLTQEEKQIEMLGIFREAENNPELHRAVEDSLNKHKEERVASDKYQFDSDVTTMKEFMQGEGGRGFNFAGSGTQADPRHTVPAGIYGQPRNVSDRVRAVIGRGLKDAEYGGNVVNAANIELGKEKPPQAGVPSAKDFTLGSLDKYGETGKYGDLERVPEKVTPPKTPTKIQVAMRAAGIPTETPIGEMSEDDAIKVLVKLKEYGGTQGDFFGFLEEKAKYHRGSGFTGFLHRVLDYFTSGGYGEEDEKVLKSVLDK